MRQFLLWETFVNAAQLLRYITLLKIPKRKIYSIICNKGRYELIYKTTMKKQDKYVQYYQKLRQEHFDSSRLGDAKGGIV